jgi:thymidylate synthase
MRFKNANEAFLHYYLYIRDNGCDVQDTKCLFNEGFYIENPLDNEIKVNFRTWKKEYAEYEWQWYLSKNRSVKEIKTKAKIWDKMHIGDDIVNSNYGWQWSRNEQLDYIIKELKKNPESRRAVITIYDGKEWDSFNNDTPCTLAINFNIFENKLNMSVVMRSNDLWFGFCNDQYCFSKLQEKLAKELDIEVGWYYHFANNLHLYNKHLCLKF